MRPKIYLIYISVRTIHSYLQTIVNIKFYFNHRCHNNNQLFKPLKPGIKIINKSSSFYSLCLVFDFLPYFGRFPSFLLKDTPTTFVISPLPNPRASFRSFPSSSSYHSQNSESSSLCDPPAFDLQSSSNHSICWWVLVFTVRFPSILRRQYAASSRRMAKIEEKRA